jgi:hypothetical protein
MCLVVNSPIQIAKRGILVWKIVKPIQNNEIPQWVPVTIDGTGAYKFNEVLKARGIRNEKLFEIENLKIVPRDGWGVPVINEGFHSFTTRHIRSRLGQKKIAIIPKGAQYAKGTIDDIVSNRIIVFYSFWKFIKYLIGRI